MLAINQYDDILHYQTILFEQSSGFENAAASGDEIVDDKCGFAFSEAPLDTPGSGAFGVYASIDHQGSRGESTASFLCSVLCMKVDKEICGSPVIALC